jgi:hypothetical protein
MSKQAKWDKKYQGDKVIIDEIHPFFPQSDEVIGFYLSEQVWREADKEGYPGESYTPKEEYLEKFQFLPSKDQPQGNFTIYHVPKTYNYAEEHYHTPEHEVMVIEGAKDARRYMHSQAVRVAREIIRHNGSMTLEDRTRYA